MRWRGPPLLLGRGPLLRGQPLRRAEGANATRVATLQDPKLDLIVLYSNNNTTMGGLWLVSRVKGEPERRQTVDASESEAGSARSIQ